MLCHAAYGKASINNGQSSSCNTRDYSLKGRCIGKDLIQSLRLKRKPRIPFPMHICLPTTEMSFPFTSGVDIAVIVVNINSAAKSLESSEAGQSFAACRKLQIEAKSFFML